jgi:large subunit ribosomal protein L6
MKKKLSRTIELSDGMNVEYNNGVLKLSKSGKEISKKLNLNKVKLDIKENKIILSHDNATRRESASIGTNWAHINNMIKGLDEEYTYELEICNIHFPMNVKKEGNTIIVKSFLGEKKDRAANILPGVEVDISGNIIKVSSINKEFAGQTAANLEKATRVVGRDRRIFQDGIFIINKPGRKI